jgi:hypothetical protein
VKKAEEVVSEEEDEEENDEEVYEALLYNLCSSHHQYKESIRRLLMEKHMRVYLYSLGYNEKVDGDD